MHEYFKNEIENIKNEDYRKFVKWYLDERTPKYFYEIGASASGKFHPQFSQGYGGLVRHTKAVSMFAEELLRMSSYAYLDENYIDYIRIACILHDTCKYGIDEFDKTEYKNHAPNASYNVANAWFEFFGINAPQYLLDAIRTHMGQWSEKENRPFTSIDRCVHMADYMASRPFIDIPQITKDWENVNKVLTTVEDNDIIVIESEVDVNV